MSYYPVKELSPQDTGTVVDFASTPITTLAYTDIKTLAINVKKLDIVHNGGGELILRKNGVDVGFIAPGYKGPIEFKAAIGDVIKFKALNNDVTSGKIYLNYLG